MRYIIYTRVSKDSQETTAQIDECNQYIKSQFKDGDEIIHFEEDSLSTRVPMENRPQLQALLRFVEEDDVLVIYKLDRLARDGNELVYIYRKITDWGVVIHSISESHIDKMNVHIYAFLAETSRHDISVRTKSKLRSKKERMERAGGVCYGYKLDAELQMHRKGVPSHGKPYKLIPNDHEQGALKLMLDLHSSGHSYQEIANKLTESGYYNRVNKPFQKMSVYRILQANLLAQSRENTPSCLTH